MNMRVFPAAALLAMAGSLFTAPVRAQDVPDKTIVRDAYCTAPGFFDFTQNNGHCVTRPLTS